MRKPDASHIDLNGWLNWLSAAAEIPNLEPLYSAIPDPGPVNSDTLGDEVRESAKSWARLIHRIAAYHDLPLIGLEMALLTDERRQSPQAPVFFNSYVTMFSKKAEALQHAYEACITRASGQDQQGAQGDYDYQSPIVIHEDLYQQNTGFFHAPIDGQSEGSSLDTASNPHLTYVYGYRVRQHGSTAREKSVIQQLSDVSEILKSKAEGLKLGNVFGGGTLVLLPFARPEFKIHSQISVGPGYRGTPGGCLFFIIRRTVEANSKELAAFLKDVRLVLAEASAAESQTAFEALSRRRGFTAAMLHGTLSSIRAIGSAALVDMLVRGDADRRLFDSDDLAVEYDGTDAERETSRQQLTKHLHQMVVAENLAASLISFADMHSERGALRRKFQSALDWNITEVVTTSWKVALQRRGLPPSTPVNWGSKNESDFSWILPSGYISESLIAGVLFELFDNAFEHGSTTQFAKGGPEVSIYGNDRTVSICVCNERRTDEQKKSPSVSGFLSRIKMLLEEISGIKLDTNLKLLPRKFEAILTLSEIQILQSEEDADTEQIVALVTPRRSRITT